MTTGIDEYRALSGLSQQEKKQLLKVARKGVESVAEGSMGNVDMEEPVSEKLSEPRGAFVSIYKKGMLRGCIGAIISNKELIRTVGEMAVAAASQDPRFRPVQAEELPYIDIEISALTPFKEVHDPGEIVVGTHGIMIEKGPSSGLLLPQVATGRNWDNITFLRETCRKAGLAPDSWKDEDARIYIFSAEVFS